MVVKKGHTLSGAKCRKKNCRFLGCQTSMDFASSQRMRRTVIEYWGRSTADGVQFQDGFKDYISQPKSNGYRSLHTTVSGRDGKRVEVQIRTHQMHDVAESGVAAHWAYREGERVENPFAVDPFDWINSLIDQITTEDDHQDFLESFKLEMYADKVFCFTPKGEVIKLPRGATPIDFAFAIHATRIGTKCVGAKVDGLRVSLWTRLRNGQSVEKS